MFATSGAEPASRGREHAQHGVLGAAPAQLGRRRAPLFPSLLLSFWAFQCLLASRPGKSKEGKGETLRRQSHFRQVIHRQTLTEQLKRYAGTWGRAKKLRRAPTLRTLRDGPSARDVAAGLRRGPLDRHQPHPAFPGGPSLPSHTPFL